MGKTVLYKLLYFSDFDYYELYEELLTGESYMKIERGPAPSHFDGIVMELEKEGKIMQKDSVYCGKHQYKYKSLEKPDLHLLTKKEMAVINNVVDKCSHMTARRISSYSHKDIPYMATEDNEEINYELVFYRDPEFTVRAEDE